MRSVVIVCFVFFLLLSLLSAILIFRAYQLGEVGREEAKTKLPPFKRLEIDRDKVANNFAKGLTFQTISSHETPHPQAKEFDEFHRFLKLTYPLVFSKCEVKQFSPYALLIKWPGQDNTLKPVLLMSHQDVVPIAPGTIDEWTHPPFAGQIKDGYIYGRGAMDVKCGVMAILETAEMMLAQGKQPKRTFYFYFGDDEEIGGKNAGIVAQYCLEQDIQFEYVLDEGGAIFSNILPGLTVPAALVAVAEKGYMDLSLSTTVIGGHSSMPGKHTAIGTLSRAIHRLEDHQLPLTIGDVPKQMLENFASRMSFKNRLVLANLWLLSPIVKRRLAYSPTMAAMLHTTTAPTVFHAGNKENVLPAHANANVNFRIIPGETTESVIKHADTVIGDDQVVIRKGKNAWDPSKISRTQSYGFNTIKLAIKTLFNNEVVVSPYMVIGATDSRYFLSNTQDVYRFLAYTITMEDLKGFHGTNERLSIDNYLQMINFYNLILNM